MDDLRILVQREIQVISPGDSIKEALRLDALAWLAASAPIFRIEKPATLAKHMVSYFVVTDETQFLLVDHRNATLWLSPGGHAEPNEHPGATVVREIKEELGIETSVNDVGSPLFITVTETVGNSTLHTGVLL